MTVHKITAALLGLYSIGAVAGVPLTPVIDSAPAAVSKTAALPYVQHVKGFWLGNRAVEGATVGKQGAPSLLNARMSLSFPEKANMATVVGVLSNVMNVPIILPGAVEYPAAPLFPADAAEQAKARTAGGAYPKRTFHGTPQQLLDRIAVRTGMLWDYRDGTIVFSD